MTKKEEKKCPLSYFKQLNRVMRKGFEGSFEKEDYREITDIFKDVSGAKIVAMNLYNEEKTKTKTIAFSGGKSLLSKAAKAMGFTLEDKEWDIIPKRLKHTQKRSLSKFSGLYEAGFGEIKKKMAYALEKTFNLGNVYVFRLTHKVSIGDIMLIFKKGEEMEEESRKILGLFCEQTGFAIAQSDLQKHLGKNKKRYEELAKQSKTFIWEVDGKGLYTYVSENVKYVIGYSPEELIKKKTVFELHPKEGREEFKKKVFKTLKNKESMRGLENPIVAKNGKMAWVLSAGKPVLGEEGNLRGYIGSDTDITKLKNAEREIEEKNEQFKVAIKGANDGIWDWNLKTNELYISPKWKEQLGYKDKELKNEFKTFEKLLHPDDKERVLSFAKKYIKGKVKKYDVEFRMLHKKGGHRWILAKGAAMYDKDGNPYRMAGSHTDITKRKKAENELKFKNALMKTEMEVFPDGILIVDENAKILSFNQRFADIWGIPDKIMSSQSGEKALKYVIPRLIDPNEFAKKIYYLNKNKKERSQEEITLKDGIVLDRYSAPLVGPNEEHYGRVWYYRDITERKKNEKEILEKNRELKKFKMAVEETSDHIAITDKDGICLYINRGGEKITGFKKKEILGQKVGTKENWGGLMENKFYREMWETIKKDKKAFRGDVKNKRKNGEYYYAKSTISPILNSKGDVIFFVGIERDITKEKQVDKAKTEFVSLASHQLRTPLSTVNWYAEILLDGDAGKLNKEQEKYMKEIYIGNQRMVELVEALLNVSRLELGTFAVDPEKVNLKDLVKSVIKEMEPKIKEKEQKMKTSCARNFPTIKADPKLLRIVLQNIISNAVKYTPEKGEVDVKIKTIKAGGKVDNKKINEDSVFIKVSDTGYGIPKPQQDKIFTKLFRADNAVEKESEGTGLGLYIAKKIVNNSGGKIWFESKKNKGTTFYVTIPLKGMKKK